MFVCEALAAGLAAAPGDAVPGETGRVSNGKPPGAGAGAGGGVCNARAAVPMTSIETAKTTRLYPVDMLIGRLNLVQYLIARYL